MPSIGQQLIAAQQLVELVILEVAVQIAPILLVMSPLLTKVKK
jgi:hypothetical protein